MQLLKCQNWSHASFWSRITRETVESQTRNPAFAWGQKVRQVNYGGCYYFEPISVADVDAMDPAVACEHFNQARRASPCVRRCSFGTMSLPPRVLFDIYYQKLVF